MDLSRLGKADAKTISTLKAWEATLGLEFDSVQDAIIAVCTSRMELARDFLEVAEKAMRMRPPHYRTAVSKAYYAMYHSLRTVVFIDVGGDDHEAHSKLPTKIPNGFPDRDDWLSSFREARLARNQADYEPIVFEQSISRDRAKWFVETARSFIPLAEVYLRRKGVPV